MITFTRGLVAAALLALPLAAGSPHSAAADPHPIAVPMTLAEGIRLLPVAAESREGYQRTSFKHWVDSDRDGCNTRMEVLIDESQTPPTIGTGCKVAKGKWLSYYDGQTVIAPGGLDIDHMVPLAEAWDSGAYAWSAQRREAYANDLGADRSLVAVTAKTNRSKADQDPREWLPPQASAHCQYLADWVSTKARWSLSVDPAEREALARTAAGCEEPVEFEPAL